MNGKEELNPVAKWTVMVYFAADNDLEEEAIADLKEMKKVGSTDEVNIVAQLDSRGRGKTFRFLIGDDQTTLDEDVVGELPEINTGDPRELTDFIVWGAKTYGAENYMLVLWGHGRGWEDLDNSDRAAAPTTDAVLVEKGPAEQGENGYEEQLNGDQSIAITRQKEIRTFLKNRTDKQKTRETLKSQIARDDIGKAAFRRRFQFRTGLAPQGNGDYSIDSFDQTSSKRTESESLIGFLTDQTPGKESEISQDVLKLSELEVALAEAIKSPEALNGRKIDILGMDACLMGMAEVGYQIREQVKYLVASEDAIPDEGWPYERILNRLVKNPDMPPQDLAVTIVREFLMHYREQNKDVTKSVCNLSMSVTLAKAVEELAKKLKDNISDKQIGPAILASRAMTQSFYLKDYVDLYDFCARLGSLTGDKGIEDSCSKLMDIIRSNKQNDDNAQMTSQTSSTMEQFVYVCGFIGHRLRDANGVSIYFPCFNPSPKYAELQFAEKSKWGAFLSALSGLFPKKGSFSEAGLDTVGVPLVAVGGRVKADGGTAEKVERVAPHRLPKPLPRRKPKHPATLPEKPITVKTAAKRKKEVAKK
jgi:hypothetical protein